jgi:hypothetical protein
VNRFKVDMKPCTFKLYVSAEFTTCTGPPPELLAADRGVALQVEFERQTLKPVFHLIGVRLWV